MSQFRKKMSKHSRIIALIEGITAAGLFFIGWCFATISYQSEIFGVLHICAMVFSAFCYLCCINTVHQEKLPEELQLKVLNIAITVISVLIGYADISGDHGKWYYVVTDFVWSLSGVYGVWCMQYRTAGVGRKIKECLRKHVMLLLLLLVSLFLALEPFRLQFRWDGALYEQACRLMDIHSLSSLGAYGHLSQAYGSLYYLIWILTNHTGYAMTILNVVLYLGSIVGFYLLTKQVKIEKQNILSIAATIMYAFSPFLLGMVNYYSLDYMALCLFVWMVYSAYTGKWIFHFVVALCFTFTKEPSVVVYGAFCMGMVLVDFVKCRRQGFMLKIRYLFQQYHYYLMLLIGMLWLVMYLLIGGWSGGVGEFSLDFQYIIDKLKVLYILNFNWLMVLVIIIGVGVLLIKRKRMAGLWEICFPISLSLFAYTIFSAMFKTVNHARYVATVPAMIYLLAFWMVVSVLKNWTVYFYVIMSAVMLISSYKTIDPVSMLGFQSMDIGSEIMITTGTPAIGDAMIYNKQMLRQEYALDKAITYAIEKDYKIYLPMYADNTYSFDGLMVEGSIKDELVVVTQFWDTDNNTRTAYENNKTVPFMLYEVSDDSETLPNGMFDTEGCYIYSDMIGNSVAQKIMEEKSGITPKEFSYGGWSLYMLEF